MIVQVELCRPTRTTCGQIYKWRHQFLAKRNRRFGYGDNL